MSQLKTIIQDLINDRSEQAQSTIHQYLVQKMSSLTESKKHLDEAKGSVTVWGTTAKFKKYLPQFTSNKNTAHTLLSSYLDYPENSLGKVTLTMNKTASNKDLEAAFSKVHPDQDINDNDDNFSYAEIVTSNTKVRNELKKQGFDSWKGYSVLENTEPLQYVVFTQEQVKPFVKEDLLNEATVSAYKITVPETLFPGMSASKKEDKIFGEDEGDDSFIMNQEVVTVEYVKLKGNTLYVYPHNSNEVDMKLQQRLQTAFDRWAKEQ